VEEVIRGSIFLEDDDYVFDLWRELGLGSCGEEERE
jgi:hypothetical protein